MRSCTLLLGTIVTYRILYQWLFERTEWKGVIDVVVESNILGFHVYKYVWMPVTGEVLTCEMEYENSFEPSLL